MLFDPLLLIIFLILFFPPKLWLAKFLKVKSLKYCTQRFPQEITQILQDFSFQNGRLQGSTVPNLHQSIKCLISEKPLTMVQIPTPKPYLSHDMRFPTMWYVEPAKAQTSLRICAV